jgi:hypothetical protein
MLLIASQQLSAMVTKSERDKVATAAYTCQGAGEVAVGSMLLWIVAKEAYQRALSRVY